MCGNDGTRVTARQFGHLLVLMRKARLFTEFVDYITAGL